jgi:protein ImuB
LRLEHQPIGVRLRAEPVIGESSQARLFESALRDPNRFGETLGRIAALVGSEKVGVVQLADTHEPDRFQLAPPQFEKVREVRESERPGQPLGLPLQRFRPASPAQVNLNRGIPVWFSSPHAQGEVIGVAGPYRGSGSWWDRGRWSMEEWDIELDSGALYRIAKHPAGWFVEGCYQEGEQFQTEGPVGC